jgi:hypothetical protein
MELSRTARNDNSFFKFGDQGVLNYLVFSDAQRGNLTYQTVDLFCHPSHFPKNEMATRFLKSCSKPPPHNPHETLVLHFSGKKPVPFFGGKNHKATFTFFRLKHYEYAGLPLWRAWLTIIVEDIKLLTVKVWRKAKRMFFGL